MEESRPSYYFMKCGCGVFATDYPFIAECLKCGYHFAGSKEDIKRWKEQGKLMEMIDPKTLSGEEKTRLIDEYEYEANVFAGDDYFNEEGDEEWGYLSDF